MTGNLSDNRTGLLLAVGGCLPFAIAPYVVGRGTEILPETCVVQMTTGLPCPFCGTTRAFALASAGNPGFLSYNAFWVFVAVALIASGLTMVIARASPPALLTRNRNLPIYLVIGALALGWACAMVNRTTIIG